MNEDRKILKERQQIEYYENEIELIDILRVLWKWKYLIISGSVVCGLIAAIISISMSKIYSVDMTLSPGILSIGEGGKNVYIDSPQNIKTLIESEIFNNDILKYLNDARMEKIPKRLNFKVTIAKESNIIKVKYETSDIKQGVVIQDRLSKLIIETSVKIVQYFKNEYDSELSLLKKEIDYIKATIQSHKRSLESIEKRIVELISEIKSLKNNNDRLYAERNKLLSKIPKENFNLLFFANTIQQNLTLSKNYLNDYKLIKEEKLQIKLNLEHELEKRLNEIKKIQFKKDNIQNIQVLQPPTKNPYPTRPRAMRNVIFALVIGLFLMIFLAFLLEYIKKIKS